MIRILCRYPDETVELDIEVDRLPMLLADERNLVWVDMQEPADEEYHLILQDTMHFHPLTVEDTMADTLLPKLDDYGPYLFLVFHTVFPGDEPLDFHTDEVDVFLSKNYLVTVHDRSRESINKCWTWEHHLAGGMARGPAMMLYELLDRQVDNYIPLIDKFEERLEQLGDDIFHVKRQEREMLNELLTAKSSALRLGRMLAPQRELVSRLSVGEYPVVPQTVRIYYRDVYDHMARLTNLAESMRDLATSTIETHLALVNNRMNEVMKVLTMISTIFIPLSFVAGVYGMNFEHMPELAQPWAYPAVWGVFLSISAGMMVFFRRRGWI